MSIHLSAGNPIGRVGQSFNATYARTGGTGQITWNVAWLSGSTTVPGLPPGLNMSTPGNVLVIKGQPSLVGMWQLQIDAVDSATPATTEQMSDTIAITPATPTPPTPPTPPTRSRPWLHTGLVLGAVVVAAIIVGAVLNAGHVSMFEDNQDESQATRVFLEKEHIRTQKVAKKAIKKNGKRTRKDLTKVVKTEGKATRTRVDEKASDIIANSDANTADVLTDNRRTRAAVFAANRKRLADGEKTRAVITKEGAATRAQVRKPRKMRLDLGKAFGMPGGD